MSTTIDNKVVEMRFDNKQFEQATRQSMSTLDKLKQKLNFKDSSKGLENINSAAKKVDMKGLGAAVDTVHARFSALDVMGVTALANITNSAVNAGKRIVKALTIDPVKTGFNEYETKINSIQTIMSNTASKGTTMADVTKVIDELNTYADKTIYNFAEMTRNIGTFTAAGIGLEDSAKAIQGIANLAAASGSNAQQASTAMYQLSQALSSGTLKLQDWNSVVNAGMGGQLFQDALKQTARNHGIAVDAMIEKNGSFRESLREEWITSDVLIETLNKMTKTGAAEYLSNLTGISKDHIEAVQKEVSANKDGTASYEELATAMAETGNVTKDEAINILKMADNAEDAATKVKTFSQLMDTLKESVQSGWGKTWEILFGDFEEAKELFTGLSDFFGGIINKTSDFRNNILEAALGSPLGQLAKKVSGLSESTKAAIEPMKEYAEIVNRVMSGEFGNGQARWDALTEAGYDWAKVQNMVNEKLGDSTRHLEQVAEAQAENTKQTEKLTDAKLKEAGLTEEEIRLYRELEAQSKKTGIPINELIKDMDQLDGRTLLINSFKNAGQGLVTTFQSIGKAWKEIFPEMNEGNIASGIYDAISAFHKFSKSLRMTSETADNVKRTFKGVFALLDIVTTLIGGPLKISLKAVSKLLGMFNTDIFSVTARIGDAIVAFRDWIDAHNVLINGFDAIFPTLQKAAKGIHEWIETLKESDNIPRDVIAGLVNGLRAGVKMVAEAAIDIGKSILETIKDFLGIHSPSVKMYEVGKFAIQGFVNGIRDSIKTAITVVKELGSKVLEAFNNIDWGAVFATGASVALLTISKRLLDILDRLTAPLDGLGNLFDGAGEVLHKSAKGIAKTLKSFSKVLKSFAFSIKAEAMKDIAISLAILVGSIALLTYLDADKIWTAIQMLGAVAAILAGMTVVVEGLAILSSKFGSGVLDFGKIFTAMTGISMSIMLISMAVKQIGSLNPDQAKQGFEGLANIVLSLVTVLAAYGLLVKGKSAQNINKLGTMLVKMSVSMLLMIGVIKLVSGLDQSEIQNGVLAITGFVGIITLLSYIAEGTGKNVDKLGKMMIRMAISMGLMVGVIKLISGLEPGELVKGGIAILGFVGIVGLLTKVTQIAKDKTMAKLGGTLMAMSTSMLLMVGVIKLMSGLSVGEIVKGGVCILAFTGIIALMVKAMKMIEKDAPKMATTLLAMSISIGILAGICVLLSIIDVKALAKGVAAVGMLGAVMTLMIWATRGASECKANLIVMTIAIGVMATAVAALSFIDPTRLAGATIAMSMVMGMFALIAKSSSVMLGSTGPLIAMTVAVGLIGGMIYLLSSVPFESSIGAAASMSILLLAMSASMAIISKTGPLAVSGLVALGIMTLIVGALGGILYLLSDMPVDAAIGTASAITILLTGMSGALVILGMVGTLGPAAFIGIGALATLVVGMGTLITAIGALVTKFPMLEEFLNTGIPILEKIGFALGSFFGNMIGGFASGITSGLPQIGADLSAFIVNATPFLAGIKMASGEALNGAKNLAQMILILTGANLIESIASFITGESSLASFGAELVPFGKSFSEFAETIKGVDGAAVEASANAAKALAEFAKSIPNEGGLLAKITGENDISAFAEKLVPFGKAIKEYATEVKGIDGESIIASANAGKALAEFAKAVPNEGGLLAKITGENDIATFAKQLVPFGKAIKEYAANVVGLDTESINNSVNATKSIIKIAKEIPNSGGLAAVFTGDNDISDFASGIKKFGKCLKSYSESVVGVDQAAIANSVTATAGLMVVTKKLPKEGGLKSLWGGEKDIASFGSSIVAFGKSLKNYAIEVTGIDIAAVTSASVAVTGIVNAIKKANNVKTDNIGSFISAAKKLGNLKIDSSSLSTSASSVSSSVNKMMSVINSKIRSSKSSVNSSMKTALSGLAPAIKSETSKVIAAANSMTTQLTKAISGKKDYVSRGCKTMVSGASGAIRTYYYPMYYAGQYLGDGLTAGMKSRQTAVYNAGYKLGQMAVKGEKDGQKSNSPSKLTIQAGKWIGEGLIIGMEQFGSKVYRTGYELGDNAAKSMSNAVSRIKDTLDGNIDTQPTIRPVLDLSNITSGANMINGMLGIQPSVGVLANVGAINTSMNSRNQNGFNFELISAINGLNKRMDEKPGDTITINGITYDDGSNIIDAVRTIVRAAVIERRV